MGCFLGCFGAEKDRRRRKQSGNRASPQRQRNRVQNVLQQENLVTAEQSTKETNPNLDPELRNKLEGVEQLSLSLKEGTTLHSIVTGHEHVPVKPSVDFQPEDAPSTDKEKKHDLKILSEPYSISGDDNSDSSSVKSYTSNLKNKPKGSEQSSPSPKKRVTFNSNVTTYEHVSVHESVDFQKDGTMQEDIKTPSQLYSAPEDEDSVTSSVASYPPNHRYHNARDSDDEAEEYGDSDLDDMDDDDEDYYDDYDEDVDVRIADQEVWSESVLPAASMESRTGSHSPQAMNEEVESSRLDVFGSKTNARDRSNYINSVLNPVGNTTQWKAAKSRIQQQHLLKPQKENLVANFSFEPTFEQQLSKATKSEKSKNANQEMAVDASLSTWLSSPENTPSKKTTNFGGLETFKPPVSEESCTVMSFEDRPILGALTVEELRQISKSDASPRKSPSRSPDEMPIIGTVGTYWNHLNSSAKHSDSSFKGIPNTTSKYREDKRVNWHSTPFEKRLDRAISRGGTEA